MAAHIEIRASQEFVFAENTDSCGVCCCWKSNSKPKQFVVDENLRLKPKKKTNVRERIEANQRLCQLIKERFDNDPINSDRAFEFLKMKINEKMIDDPITSEMLEKVVLAIYDIKEKYAGQETFLEGGSKV